MDYILEQYLAIKPYRDLLGDGISPIVDCFIDNWERMGVMAGFTEDEAEYMVEGIMRLDYIRMAQFCQEHNIK
jgi:hypothetical protein